MNAPSESAPALPGPKKRQAEALFRNVDWLARTFGEHRIGFLTLTCGEPHGGRFRKVTDRAEASRRFNSLLTNIIKRRYRCGVTVMERHKDGGIHFHLICVTAGDIRSGFRWDDYDRVQAEVKARRRRGWRADDVGASRALRDEWEFWRERAEAYGFGRCQMLPIRKNGEAVGRYAAKYVTKSWEERRPEDKGARLVRYFGKWETVEREAAIEHVRRARGDTSRVRLSPHFTAAFGRLSPMARLWRECARQVAVRCALEGVTFDERTVKVFAGRRWAWHWTTKFNATRFLPSKRHAGIERERDEWEAGVVQEWGADLRRFHIADATRGVAFWQMLPDNERELHECRKDNRKLRWLHEACAEMEVGQPLSHACH